MSALLDIEGFREKMEFAPLFVVGDLGVPLFAVSWNRFSFNIKFKFTVFGLVHSSVAARANFWRLFISLLRAVPFSMVFISTCKASFISLFKSL